MNLNSYRFSISWPRIQPSGSGLANRKHDYYSRSSMPCWKPKSARLLRSYHWDLPQVWKMLEAGPIAIHPLALPITWSLHRAPGVIGVSDWMLFNRTLRNLSIWGISKGTTTLPGAKSLLGLSARPPTREPGSGCRFSSMKATRPSARVGTAFICPRASRRRTLEEDTLATERASCHDQLVVPGTRAQRPLPRAAGVSSGNCHGDQVRRSGKDEGAARFIGVNLYYRAIVSAPSAWSGSHTRSSGCSGKNGWRRARSEDQTLDGRFGRRRWYYMSRTSLAISTVR